MNDRWAIEAVFEDDAAALAAIVACEPVVAELARFRGTLGDPVGLAAFLEATEQVERRLTRLGTYALMRLSTALDDPAAQALRQRVDALSASYGATTAYWEPELAAIAPDTLRHWVGAGIDGTRARWVERVIARQPHRRSAEVEELLEQVQEPFAALGTIGELLVEGELDLGVAVGELPTHLQSADPAVRRAAYRSTLAAVRETRGTLATALAGHVRQSVFVARARGYGSTLEAALAEAEVPVSVHAATIAGFERNLPVWHRYWAVRRRLAGGDLTFGDVRARLAADSPPISYEQACSWIVDSLAPLGPEYVAAATAGLGPERWVDLRPRRGKVGGGFSAGDPSNRPFILMNWTEDVESLSILAHELGHSLHSLSTYARPWWDADYTMFAAETASNVGQTLLRAHLLAASPSRELEIALLDEAMINFHRYLFVMPTLARLEHELHTAVWAGAPVTAASLGARCAELFEEGYGGHVTGDRDLLAMTWATYPHLYVDYYAFQYTTGLAAAQALAAPIVARAPGAAERYLAFLGAGLSKPPLDALQDAGVDMGSPGPLDAAFTVLGGIIDRIETLCG